MFGAAGKRPGKLTVEQIHKLTISSRGKEEMRRVLKGFGGKSTKATVTMVIKGSRWTILGGAGKPDQRVKELTGGEDEWKLKLNLTDLSVFQFNDNRAKSNFSQWVEGKTLVEKMKAKVGEKLTDRSNIDNKIKEMKEDFIGRLVVLPMGGNNMSCCFTMAPVSEEGMKKICMEKACLENSP